jgi:hypothetical protein
MATCALHPGREAVLTLYGRPYCAVCKKGIAAAQAKVDKHVEPKECFIWYAKDDDWQPISGTGCAHWVAHQRQIRAGNSMDQCLAGYTYRVKTLIVGHHKVASLALVKINDIYVTPGEDHMGLVVKVTPGTTPGSQPTITIRHDSSHQGRVAENDFATYFKGKGSFYR